MSEAAASEGLTGEDLVQALQQVLFPKHSDEEELNTYAVLDGAAIPDLLDHLYGDEPPEFECLYSGEIEPDMAECAPYLVELKPDATFTKWLLLEGWGKSWGIFALSPNDLGTMRRHFRTFLMVKAPDGKQLYFRYYDPRNLSIYLPTTNAEERAAVFGPISGYYCESENGPASFVWTRKEGLNNPSNMNTTDTTKIWTCFVCVDTKRGVKQPKQHEHYRHNQDPDQAHAPSL